MSVLAGQPRRQVLREMAAVKKSAAQLEREITAVLSKGISEGWYITDEVGTKHVFYGPFASKDAAYRAAYYRNAFVPDYENKFLTGVYSPLHVDNETSRYLREVPEDVFGKGAKVTQRSPSQVKLHPSWREEWGRWKKHYPDLTYSAFQDRHWANVWAKYSGSKIP